ncbi:hypothetical protein GOP47_0010735 [Adiantum capillus-veneris]|uniref:Uncharacterized protein n=1 Tax=Adiantum capillus-veneris TaxID=13818 RepID=A0A9D4UVU6_ADICA|nr:hypothetical protein GOP47_0010735 [Adiantum capillus-veneris]
MEEQANESDEKAQEDNVLKQNHGEPTFMSLGVENTQSPMAPRKSCRRSISNSLSLITGIRQTPMQPNGFDGGYYVMTIMRFLIIGGLQHKRSRQWLSKKMFKHEDVEDTKKSLHSWTQKLLVDH